LGHSKSIDNCELCKLWHIRIAELSADHGEVCKGCTLAKYANTIFPGSDSREGGTLDLVHPDLCGLMSTTSLEGYEYYVTFIHDFSKKNSVYFLNNKESQEVLQNFKEFKALVENQTWRRIQVL